MKVVIFSDTHLTSRFNPDKYDYLCSIIEPTGRVIINGDFWDRYSTTFDAFIASPWKKLFPLLRKKGAVYLFGNHDKKKWSDKRRDMFSIIQDHKFVLDSGEYRLYCEHGDKIAPKIDASIPFTITFPIFGYSAKMYEKMRIKLVESGFLKLGEDKYNKKMKQYAAAHLKKGEILVCGHSHFPEIALARGFVNSGFIRNNYASYIVVENSSISLVKGKYK